MESNAEEVLAEATRELANTEKTFHLLKKSLSLLNENKRLAQEALAKADAAVALSIKAYTEGYNAFKEMEHLYNYNKIKVDRLAIKASADKAAKATKSNAKARNPVTPIDNSGRNGGFSVGNSSNVNFIVAGSSLNDVIPLVGRSWRQQSKYPKKSKGDDLGKPLYDCE